MLDWITSFVNAVGSGVWSVLKAILILILAFIVASLVRSLVRKLLNTPKVSAMLNKTGEGGNSLAEFISKLVYLLVFLLFVPGIFSSLGMDSVSSPILNLLNTMWGYVPNIVAAGIVLWVGFFVAKLVRELLVPVFGKLKIDRLQEMAGIETDDSGKLSNMLAYIVYVLILIPVIITALQALNISAISAPAVGMLNMVFSFIPNILVALVIIIVGCMVAKLAGSVVKNLIASSGLDAKLAGLLEGKAAGFVLSKAAGMVVQVVLIVFFVVEGLNVLHLDVLTEIGAAVIGYMPFVLAAALILAVCFISSGIAQKALKKAGFERYGILAKCAIFVVGGFMILNELGIAPELVNTTFVVAVAAVAVAFAIAFGIGGKDFAAGVLKRIEDKKDEKNEEK